MDSESDLTKNAVRPHNVARRPWRFSVSSPSVRTRAQWHDFAKRAESLGYDVLYVADHTTYIDPLAVCAAVAQATTRLKVGTLVLNAGLYHPLLLARTAATVQLLTDNRLELGLGAGWAKAEHDALGVAFGSRRERVDLLVESLHLVRAALRGDPIVATAHFPVTQESAPPGPLEVVPPLVIGGFGERLLRACAPLADVIQLTGLGDDNQGALRVDDSSTAGFATRVGWIRQATGERFADIELSVLVQRLVVTTDAIATADATATVAGEFGVTPDRVADSPTIAVGTVEEIVAKFRRLERELGITHVTVFAPAMDEFAPVIDHLRPKNPLRSVGAAPTRERPTSP